MCLITATLQGMWRVQYTRILLSVGWYLRALELFETAINSIFLDQMQAPTLMFQCKDETIM